MKKLNENIYNHILNKLKDSKETNKSISGSKIAKEENITRSYVSKVITRLIEQGYDIKRVNRIGYIYQGDTKVLDGIYIKHHLYKPKEVRILDCIDSTNNYLKQVSKEENIEELIAVANMQTLGKGRLGRNFVCQKSSGIYMSLLLRPNISLEQAKKLTCLTAAATSIAIDNLTGLKSKIKWVNDIYLNSKKVCGILTEAITSIEQGSLESVIIGIGINVYHQDFADDIKMIATTIEDETNRIISRNKLIVEIINQMDKYLEDFDNNIYMDEYINRSLVIGKNVELYKNGQIYDAKVINITKDGELEVLIGNEKQIVSSGEITRMVLKNE